MFQKTINDFLQLAEKLPGIPIGVIITTHDGRKDVCLKAVTSVLAQTYEWIKIYVVYDGLDTDGTFDFINKHLATMHRDREHILKIRPIEFIEMPQRTKKASILRNEGIRRCIKDHIPLVAFLDSDNLYLRDHIRVLYALIKEGYDLVWGNRDYITAIPNIAIDAGEIKYHPPMEKMDVSYSRVLRGDLEQVNFIDTSDMMFTTRSLIEIGGWDETTYKSRFPDWNIVYRYWKANYPMYCFEFAVGRERTEQPNLTSYLWSWDNLGEKDKKITEQKFRTEILPKLEIYQHHLDDCKKLLLKYD